MKVACVLVTHLRAKVEIRRHPHLRDRPAVIVDRSGPRPVVVDHLPACRGVAAGMTLEQALSRQADAEVLEADAHLISVLPESVQSDARLQCITGVSATASPPEREVGRSRPAGCSLRWTPLSWTVLEDMYGGEARLVNW